MVISNPYCKVVIFLLVTWCCHVYCDKQPASRNKQPTSNRRNYTGTSKPGVRYLGAGPPPGYGVPGPQAGYGGPNMASSNSGAYIARGGGAGNGGTLAETNSLSAARGQGGTGLAQTKSRVTGGENVRVSQANAQSSALNPGNRQGTMQLKNAQTMSIVGNRQSYPRPAPYSGYGYPPRQPGSMGPGGRAQPYPYMGYPYYGGGPPQSMQQRPLYPGGGQPYYRPGGMSPRPYQQGQGGTSMQQGPNMQNGPGQPYQTQGNFYPYGVPPRRPMPLRPMPPPQRPMGPPPAYMPPPPRPMPSSEGPMGPPPDYMASPERGGMMPSQGGMPPPDAGMMPPPGGMLPPEGGMMQPQGPMPPPEGGMMQPQGPMPPPGGGMMPPQGGMPPPEGAMMPPQGPMQPPPEAMGSPEHQNFQGSDGGPMPGHLPGVGGGIEQGQGIGPARASPPLALPPTLQPPAPPQPPSGKEDLKPNQSIETSSTVEHLKKLPGFGSILMAGTIKNAQAKSEDGKHIDVYVEILTNNTDISNGSPLNVDEVLKESGGEVFLRDNTVHKEPTEEMRDYIPMSAVYTPSVGSGQEMRDYIPMPAVYSPPIGYRRMYQPFNPVISPYNREMSRSR